MTSINDTTLRDEITDNIPSDAELPQQMGEYITLMPGTDLLSVPANIGQLIELFDDPERDGEGQEISGGKVLQRVSVHFDRENPLTVVGGKHNGLPLTAYLTNVPRKRGKKGSDAPSVADMTYLLRECLQDKAALQRPRDWIDALKRGANRTIRLKHGLQGKCRPDKVRYIDDGQGGTVTDPAGTFGCGKRYYTSAFRQDDGTYSTEVLCECDAVVRGFSSIDQYLPPMETGQG